MTKIPVILNKDYQFYNPILLWSDEHPDKKERVDRIIKEIEKNEIAVFFEADDFNIDLVKNVHSGEYINFLQSLEKLIVDDGYYFPANFWHEKNNLSNFQANLGKYSLDTGTPVTKNIFSIAHSSVAIALTAAKFVKEGDKVVYAACRPSGHHAMKCLMGGFCYLNNAAVAGQYLSQFGKVAILDIDYHHGNGTQDIFYDRDDVLTVSIHADPNKQFPYYWGFENEIGVGLGEGKNLNIILDSGASNDDYEKALDMSLKKIKDFKAKYLVISLGLDTYEKDSVGDFKLMTSCYQKMAENIKELDLPTVIVQEGGYHEDIGINVVSFLKGFLI